MDAPKRFVILSQPRTGSTLLCSLLNSHPGVRALVEPVNPRGHNHHMKPMQGSRCLLPEIMVQNNLVRALRILFDADAPPTQWILSKKKATVAAGFKIMAHQIRALKSEAAFWDYLVQEKIPVVLCFRYNILMQYLSDLITQATKQAACWDGAVKTAKVRVDIAALEGEFKRIIEEKTYLINRCEELGLDRRRVKYEDFKDDVTPAEDLLEWLIGERYPLSTKLSKQNPDSIRARVTNYRELDREVRRLGLENLLVDSPQARG